MNLTWKEERNGGNLSFLANISLSTQDQLHNLQEPVQKESVGSKTKVWDSILSKYWEFQDRESRGGGPAECGAQRAAQATGQ